MRTFGIIVLVLILLSAAAGAGWVFFNRIRAQRLGLPTPSLSSYLPFGSKDATTAARYGTPQPAAGGIRAWFRERLRTIKQRNARTAAGAYEEPLAAGGGGRRGFGPFDDDVWDARVGYGPYEEQEQEQEQEQGVQSRQSQQGWQHQQAAAYMGTNGDDHGNDAGYDEHERGRTRSRSPDTHPDGANPFDDDAEPSNLSLRGLSPRPIDTSVMAAVEGQGKQYRESPTERRSIFREDV